MKKTILSFMMVLAFLPLVAQNHVDTIFTYFDHYQGRRDPTFYYYGGFDDWFRISRAAYGNTDGKKNGCRHGYAALLVQCACQNGPDCRTFREIVDGHGKHQHGRPSKLTPSPFRLLLPHVKMWHQAIHGEQKNNACMIFHAGIIAQSGRAVNAPAALDQTRLLWTSRSYLSTSAIHVSFAGSFARAQNSSHTAAKG